MPFHGVAAGWCWAMVMKAAEFPSFEYEPPPLGIIGLCTQLSYPKQQDYFWFAFPVALAVLLGAAAPVIWRRLYDGLAARRIPAPVPGGRWIGYSAFAVFFILLNTAGIPAIVLAAFAAAATLMPWLDPRWGETWSPPEAAEEPPPWPKTGLSAAGIALAFALVWGWEPCRPWITIDGYHEGNFLMWIQGYLAGDVPGLDIRLFYGPLYINSMAWWMKLFGMTVYGARGYFQFTNAAGIFILVWVVLTSCRSLAARIAGVASMLLLTNATSFVYGMANMLRIGAPMLAIWAAWYPDIRRRGLGAAFSGGLLAAAFLYSQEYAVAAGAAVAVLFLMRRDLTSLMHSGAGFAGVFICSFLILFGARSWEAIVTMFGANFATAHLMGAHAIPMREIGEWASPGQFWKLIRGRPFVDIVSVWLPSIACALALTWLIWGRMRIEARVRHLLLPLAVFALISQIPVIARPLLQIGSSAPAYIWLAAVLFDSFSSTTGLSAAKRAVVCSLVFLWGLWVASPSSVIPDMRMQCFLSKSPGPNEILPRLGSMAQSRNSMTQMRDIAEAIRANCPAGARIYMAAPRFTHLAFISDRAGLKPFVNASMISTRDERLRQIEALEEFKPPLALITTAAVDVPFSVLHPEEWRYIQEHYRLLRRFGEAELYTRKSPDAAHMEAAGTGGR